MESSKEKLDAYLKSIGGLENGRRPNRPPITDAQYFECHEGWYPLIQELIEDLIKLDWDKQVIQVKEKFGGLRFYINEGSKEIHDRITEAESNSYATCEYCGSAGEARRDIGWIRTLCDQHYLEKLDHLNKKP